MIFGFTPEQEALRDSVRQFLGSRVGIPEVRRFMATETGYDPAVWKALATDIGAQSLGIPEEYGGAGFGPIGQTVIFEELGRSVAGLPYFATIGLAANVLLQSGDDAAKKQYLPGIAAGTTTATLAIAEDDGFLDPDEVTLTATEQAGSWTLSGHKSFVVDGASADLVLVVARSAAGVSLFAVDHDAKGLSRVDLPAVDETRKLARLAFAEVAATLVGADGGAAPGVSVALDLASIALAAEQVGIASRCLEMAAAYAKTRTQFGKPIGSFQGVKHLCADMMVAVETSRSAAYYAAWAADAGADDLHTTATLARAHCADACLQVAGDNIQVHGGIGFTWEHDAHLYFKRAKTDQLLLGSPDRHRANLLTSIGV
jgi:alkylation response protein AidB-like acyl-CoA dehydrogenase